MEQRLPFEDLHTKTTFITALVSVHAITHKALNGSGLEPMTSLLPVECSTNWEICSKSFSEVTTCSLPACDSSSPCHNHYGDQTQPGASLHLVVSHISSLSSVNHPETSRDSLSHSQAKLARLPNQHGVTSISYPTALLRAAAVTPCHTAHFHG